MAFFFNEKIIKLIFDIVEKYNTSQDIISAALPIIDIMVNKKSILKLYNSQLVSLLINIIKANAILLNNLPVYLHNTLAYLVTIIRGSDIEIMLDSDFKTIAANLGIFKILDMGISQELLREEFIKKIRSLDDSNKKKLIENLFTIIKKENDMYFTEVIHGGPEKVAQTLKDLVATEPESPRRAYYEAVQAFESLMTGGSRRNRRYTRVGKKQRRKITRRKR
jgi:hypothetical protein